MNTIREMIISNLQIEVRDIVFRKVDGSIRKMKCTLQHSILEENNALPKGEVKYNDAQIRVFDIEAKSWKSFLVQNLISY